MFEDELKPGRCFTDDQIERFVRVQADKDRGMSWPEICAKITDWANVQQQGRFFQEADYEALRACLHARSQRHDVANERLQAKTGRVGQDTTIKGKPAITRHIGAFVHGLTAHLEKPKLEPRANLDSELPADTGRRVRGPARHDAEERAKRRMKCRVAAGYAKLPARLRRWFTMSQLGVMSVILKEAAQVGVCALAVGTIAGRASVSASTVQDALAVAQHQRLIAVTGQDRAPNRIKVVHPDLLHWLEGKGKRSQHSISESQNPSISPIDRAPLNPSNFCSKVEENELKVEVAKAKLFDHYVRKAARQLPEPEPVVVPPVQAEVEEVRQEAAQEAVAVMEKDEARDAPLSALEAIIAKWETEVRAREAAEQPPERDGPS